MTNIEKKGYQPIGVRIYNKDRQQVLEDEVLLAFNTKTSKIVATGREARKYIDDNEVVVENPMKWGVVADLIIFIKVMEAYIKKVTKPMAIRKPRVVLCVPARLTRVEMTNFVDSFGQLNRSCIITTLYEYTFQQVVSEKQIETKKQPDFYIEFVSDYYASEYFG